MSDISSSCELVRMNSLPKGWDYCPKETEFVLKIKVNNKSQKLQYKLREGVPLPYKPKLPGGNIVPESFVQHFYI